MSQSFAATMFQPMTIADSHYGYERNSEENSSDTSQLGASKNGDNNCERMQVNTMPDQPRIDKVILEDTQHAKEDENTKRGPRAGMQQCQDSCQRGHR